MDKQISGDEILADSISEDDLSANNVSADDTLTNLPSGKSSKNIVQNSGEFRTK